MSSKKNTGVTATGAQPRMRRSRLIRRRPTTSNHSNLVTKQELHGGKLSVPTNPPDVTLQPWFPTTLVILTSMPTSKNYSMGVAALVKALSDQLDPTGHAFTGANTTILNIRMVSVRCWNLDGNVIGLSCDDFSDSAKAKADVDHLCSLLDTTGQGSTACVGYEYPDAHKHFILRNGTDDNNDSKVTLFTVIAPSGNSLAIYVSLLWKFDGPAKMMAPASMLANLLSAAKSTQRNTAKIVENTTSSAISTIFEGVKHGALLTVSAGAGQEDLADQISRLSLEVARLSSVNASILRAVEINGLDATSPQTVGSTGSSTVDIAKELSLCEQAGEALSKERVEHAGM